MWRPNQKSQKKSKENSMDAHEQEAVAAVRDALARVIADGVHDDRARAIEAIRAIDRGWRDEGRQYSVTLGLARVYDARFDLLGSFSENTDELPSSASTQMQAALYTLDHLAAVLLTRLAEVGMAVYPTMDAPAGEMLELPRAEKDDLITAVEPSPDA